MVIDFLIDIFKENATRAAIIDHNEVYTYQWLLKQIEDWKSILEENKISPGTVVGFGTPFSANGIAAFLALINHNCIVAPMPPVSMAQNAEFFTIAQVEFWVQIDDENKIMIRKEQTMADHAYYDQLRKNQVPGLILFSSGSTGKSKAIVHDVSRLLLKYKKRGKDFRTLLFLSFDHIGGIDTLLYVFLEWKLRCYPRGTFSR